MTLPENITDNGPIDRNFRALDTKDGDLGIAITSNATIETVAAPSFATGWADLGGGYLAVGYYKDRSRVYLCGSVANSGTGTGAIFTLPTGYRPSATVMLACPIFGGTGYVSVSSAGVVTDTTFSAGSKAFTSLDPISFRIA